MKFVSRICKCTPVISGMREHTCKKNEPVIAVQVSCTALNWSVQWADPFSVSLCVATCRAIEPKRERRKEERKATSPDKLEAKLPTFFSLSSSLYRLRFFGPFKSRRRPGAATDNDVGERQKKKTVLTVSLFHPKSVLGRRRTTATRGEKQKKPYHYFRSPLLIQADFVQSAPKL